MTSSSLAPSRRTALALAATLALTLASSFPDTPVENAHATIYRAPAGATLEALTTTGPGTRMIWYPKKGAFRAGTIVGTPNDQWNETLIGFQSFAAGQNVTASGGSAVAFGSGTTASGGTATALGSGTFAGGGFGAVAMGMSSSATGYYAPFASGWNSKAENAAAHALGYWAKASGAYAMAINSNTEAKAEASLAAGTATRAEAVNAAALGTSTVASSFSSLVIGRYNAPPPYINPSTWVDTDPLFVIGNGAPPPTGQTQPTLKNAFIVTKNGDAGVQGVLRVWPAGDLGMGDFAVGPQPPAK